MRNIINKIKQTFRKDETEMPKSADNENEYVELDTNSAYSNSLQRVIIRPFELNEFAEVKQILDFIRQDFTIALVNIRPLKEKDMVELKQAINKLKKTTDAMEGEIAGLGEDYIIIASKCAQIYKTPKRAPVKKAAEEDEDM